MANEDKATRYHRLRRRAGVLATVLGAATLVLFVVSGTSASVRSLAVASSGGGVPAAIVFLLAVTFGHELLQVPLAYYQGVTLERRYGLSIESAGHWWRNHLKAVGLSALFAMVLGVALHALLRWDAERWWLVSAALVVVLLTGLARIAPVVLLPMFYDFTPLDRPELVTRLVGLARKAGTPVVGVFEWRLGDRTRKANAMLAGMGGSRRILLSDTLLASYSDDEIEVVLAHELAHQVHGDIWSGLGFEAVSVTAGFYAAHVLVSTLGRTFGLGGATDIAVLPLVLFGLAGVSLLTRPMAHALSRQHERRADRYALELTGNVAAFVSAMRRLSAQNLAEEEPSRVVQVLFHSHPSTHDRIAAAQAWRRSAMLDV